MTTTTTNVQPVPDMRVALATMLARLADRNAR